MLKLTHLSYFAVIVTCTVAMSCQSPQAESSKSNPSKNISLNTFDLAELTLTENLPELMQLQKIKPVAKDATDNTLFGFEIFKSNAAKALRFKSTELSGTGNYVLFHYDQKTGQLAGYQLTLHNQPQTDTLISLLNKAGKPVFKQTKPANGAIELDENGNPVKPENSERKTFRVWEDTAKGLSYFLTETGSGQSLVADLIVLNKTSQFGKDWISALQLDWYKNQKSE